MSHDYRPRDHDHLVEPMFGGLGLERQAPLERSPELPPVRPGFLRRLWHRIVRLVRSSRRACGP
jgi:hypothetical protein